MSWSKEWPKGLNDPEKMYSFNTKADIKWPICNPEWPKAEIVINPITDPLTFIAANYKNITGEEPLIDTAIKHKIIPLEKVYLNKVPTHDPYTNPNSHIYYECACGKILDPGTKSFAALNNAASEADWKVRWGHTNYQPYCVECGKDIE